MIVTCSSCSTRYQVDPNAIGPTGRIVKCTRCGHSWRQDPPGETLVEIRDPQTDSVRIERSPRRPRPIPKGSNLPVIPGKKARSQLMGWMVLIAVVSAVVTGGIFYRNQITHAWPPAQKLYRVLGLSLEPVAAQAPEPAAPVQPKPAAPPTTLDFRNIRPERDLSGPGAPALVIRGEIVNPSTRSQAIPKIFGTLMDDNGQVLHEWQFTASRTVLAPGGVLPFETRIEQAPPEASNLRLKFEGTPDD